MIDQIINGIFNGIGSAIGAFLATKYVLTHVEHGVEKTKESEFIQRLRRGWKAAWK